jgi:hypothetical protein
LQYEAEDYNIWQIFWRVYERVDCQGEGEGGLWIGVAEDSGSFTGKVCQAYLMATYIGCSSFLMKERL